MTILEPLTFYGEGDYALTDIKEVEVTKAFLTLDEKTKLCQDDETFKECQSNEYLRLGQKHCDCTPYELRNFSKKVRSKIIKHTLKYP